MWASTKLPCRDLLTKLCRAPMAADRLGRFLLSTTCPCPFYHHPSLRETQSSTMRRSSCASCPHQNETSCHRIASSLHVPKGPACLLRPTRLLTSAISICPIHPPSSGNVPANYLHGHLFVARCPPSATPTWSGPMVLSTVCLSGCCSPSCVLRNRTVRLLSCLLGSRVYTSDVAPCRPTCSWPG